MPDLSLLNEAQYKAVTAGSHPLLVIAGAGSGKTRTIVYRLAHLAENGVNPHSILLLTFTKKAAQEMLHRAAGLLGSDLMGVQGGTFHAFSYTLLRQFPPSWAKSSLSILDSSDCTNIISHCREEKKIGKGDRSFPKNATIHGLISKARNKEMPLEEILRRESQHLLPHVDALCELETLYHAYRREHNVLDYDDLLFELEVSLKENPVLLSRMHDRFRHIMVDEYQDTNMVQARLVRLLTGEETAVMAVGDDAQSIYAFRGANVQNILDFPKLFPNCEIVRLEENYRSVQPILDIANTILENAPVGFQKHLYSKREYDKNAVSVQVVRPISDITQARIAGRFISELLHTEKGSDIAVLFRAGYQSYHLEVELNKLGIGFKKYGGVKYTEASHIKDVLSYLRLLLNPTDLPAFERMASLCRGIGPKTAHKLFSLAMQGDREGLQKACKKYPDFWADLQLLMEIQKNALTPEKALRLVIDQYQPRMELLYPDDWPRRQQGLEELIGIASSYNDIAVFMADLSLENPDENSNGDEDDDMQKVILSTVHSAKGLEWKHVFILDLVEDRFPSRHALTRAEDYEEERRLLYVACTRAKDSLRLFVPQNILQRGQGFEERAAPSPFIKEIHPYLYEEVLEQYGGVLVKQGLAKSPLQSMGGQKRSVLDSFREAMAGSQGTGFGPETFGTEAFGTGSFGENGSAEKKAPLVFDTVTEKAAGPKAPAKLGFCRHKIFGRGKIIEEIDAEKVRVNFPGIGPKAILKAYLVMED